jgi:hypothetical protein
MTSPFNLRVAGSAGSPGLALRQVKDGWFEISLTGRPTRAAAVVLEAGALLALSRFLINAGPGGRLHLATWAGGSLLVLIEKTGACQLSFAARTGSPPVILASADAATLGRLCAAAVVEPAEGPQ